ncbi:MULTISPECIES: hypothetical protein [unclassified Exiguobacterium]|uniref:hypothetical protein n=1 Tax=unclassified Exiguobacterium TaxID=2644629 RepID=UPI001BE7EE01|nr:MULTISPECIES: hypothetical protein [unclassified Exiguobacterium]
MNDQNRLVQEDTWWKSPLRIKYVSFVFILMALAVSYFEGSAWLTVPLIILGVTMIGLDVSKYQKHRTHVSGKIKVKSLKWELIYDLVDSAILIVITVALLFMQIDTLTIFIVLTLWVVFGQTFQKQFGERMPSVEQSEKQRLKR